MGATNIYLVDVDVFVEGSDQHPKREYLERVAKFGHWQKHDRLTLVRSDVAWIETLGHIAEHAPPPPGRFPTRPKPPVAPLTARAAAASNSRRTGCRLP